MAKYGPEEWWYPDGTLVKNERIAVFGPGNDNEYAEIFSDAGLTVPLANPNVTSMTGTFEFYAADGTYWVYAGTMGVGTGFEVTLGANPDDPVLSVNGHGPDGGGNVTLTASDVGALEAADNLSDLPNAATARTNLGLGTSATRNVGTVAGTVAAGDDSRITGAQQRSTITQKGGLYVGTGPATVVELAPAADGRFLSTNSAQPGGVEWVSSPGGAVDSVNTQTGVVVLDAGDVGADPAGSAAAAQAAAIAASDPLGSAATAQANAIAASLQKSANLSDLNNATTARTNLGLGDSATRNVGTTNGTVAAGDDARIVGAVQSVATPSVLYGTDGAGTADTYTIVEVTGDTLTTFNDGRNVLTTGNGAARWINRQGQTYRIVGVWVTAGIQPTGAAIIVDVNLNGTTIFTTQANRPTVPAASNGGAISATPNVTALAPGDVLTVDIDQIGSTIAGGNISVGIVVDKSL